FEPTKSYQFEGYTGKETQPHLRVAVQYNIQKKVVIVKVISLHSCDLFADDVTQVRISYGRERAKQQTAVVRGEEPAFNQTFSFTDVGKAEIQTSSLRFRVYSRSGMSRMNLRAEGQLEGKKVGRDSPTICSVPLNKINTIKSEVPMRRLESGKRPI
ncbi:unnamed protein product, partial [Strongylus vulgaris]